MKQIKHSSSNVFFTFGAGLCTLVFLLVLINVFIRSTTDAQGSSVWEEVHETPGMQEAGLTIMRKTGCFLCHRIDNFGGEIGPRLNGVKDRKTRQELFDWIRSPHTIKPNTIMPEFHLPDDQIHSIISYLETK